MLLSSFEESDSLNFVAILRNMTISLHMQFCDLLEIDKKVKCLAFYYNLI